MHRLQFFQLLKLSIGPAEHFIGSHLNQVPRTIGVRRPIEERIEPIKLVMCDRIKLVRMTLSTPDGQSHPNGSRRVDAINQSLVSILVRLHAAFFVDHCISMKCRRNELGLGGIRKQITR